MKVELTKEELEIIQTGLEVGMIESQIPDRDNAAVKSLIEKLGLNKSCFSGYFPMEYLRERIVFRAYRYLGVSDVYTDGTNPCSHRRIIDSYNSLEVLPRRHKASYNDPWSCIFVSVVALEEGCQDIVPMECSCFHQMQLFKQRGQWNQNDYTPKPGDFVYYSWEHRDYPNHVGIVVGVYPDKIVAVEGNVGGCVCLRIRLRHGSSSFILGYGVPDYGRN